MRGNSTVNSLICNGNGRYSFKSSKCICYSCFNGRTCDNLGSCLNGGVKNGSSNSCICPMYVGGRCCERPSCAGQGTRNRLEKSCTCPYPEYQFGRYCEKIRCANGGLDSRGYCSCPYGFNGRFCQHWSCKNDGIPSSNNTCECTPYTSGQHCEAWECMNRGTKALYGSGCECASFFTGTHCENFQYYPDLLVLCGTAALLVAMVCFFIRKIWKQRHGPTATSTSPMGQLRCAGSDSFGAPDTMIPNINHRRMPRLQAGEGVHPGLSTEELQADQPPPYPNDLPSYTSLFGDTSGNVIISKQAQLIV